MPKKANDDEAQKFDIFSFCKKLGRPPPTLDKRKSLCVTINRVVLTQNNRSESS